jgi:hypothetical protein
VWTFIVKNPSFKMEGNEVVGGARTKNGDALDPEKKYVSCTLPLSCIINIPINIGLVLGIIQLRVTLQDYTPSQTLRLG